MKLQIKLLVVKEFIIHEVLAKKQSRNMPMLKAWRDFLTAPIALQ